MRIGPKLLVLSMLAFGASGCAWTASLLTGEPPVWGDAAEVEPGIGGQTVWSGDQAAVRAASTMVARTPEQWQALWERVGREPPGPLPEGWMGIGIFAGPRNSGGHSVQIASILSARQRREIGRGAVAPERLVVSYRVPGPAPGTMVTQQLTSPWLIRLERVSPLPVEFRQVD